MRTIIVNRIRYWVKLNMHLNVMRYEENGFVSKSLDN